MPEKNLIHAVDWRDAGLWRRRRDLEIFLGGPVRLRAPFLVPPGAPVIWLGWGRKKSGQRARASARRAGSGFLLLEDGFVRSSGLGVNGARALSIVADSRGVYYDATTPCDLENTLNAGRFSSAETARAARALAMIRRLGLSKYNTGLPVPADFFPPGEARVLVVDQTAGDLSLRYGRAGPETFREMLRAALKENPRARVYVKTHPDVLAGRRSGCLPRIEDERITWLAGDWAPHDLLRHFEKVYVATSLMGFDALILGKQVHCFGMPFYAGWGLTEDRQTCARRKARRTLPELAAAALLRHARYLDPETGEACGFFTAARHIARQTRMTRFWAGLPGGAWSGRVFAFGFQMWKRPQARPFFGARTRVVFVSSVSRARRAGISSRDRIVVWGHRDPAGLRELEAELGLKAVRAEDGFLRSAGLGAWFIPPRSLVFDDLGIYFDPTRESRLERLLNTADISPALLKRARALREFIVARGLSKYNLDDPAARPLELPHAAGAKVILVPGQVETDASIRLGCEDIRTNLGLLERTRRENPGAYIIYKPHPDVMAGNRRGRVHLRQALRHCDHVETRAGILSCIAAASEVHTMTSLSGFDALLRGVKVVCHGRPFYAGWGLTEDRLPLPRRVRQRSLDELAACVLLLYPVCYGRELDAFVSAAKSAEMLSRDHARRPRLPGAAEFVLKLFRYAAWSARGAAITLAQGAPRSGGGG